MASEITRPGRLAYLELQSIATAPRFAVKLIEGALFSETSLL